MSATNEMPNNNLVSLRLRYLITATLIVIVLLIGAVATHLHTQQVLKNNTSALEVRVHANKALSIVRSALWQSNISLNTLLVSPAPIREKAIMVNVNLAISEVNDLKTHIQDNNPILKGKLLTLSKDLNLYKERVSFLLNKRKDVNWVYPITLYINEKLFVSLSAVNMELISMSSANVGLVQETADIVSKELWAFFILSLASLIGIYIMIDHFLLRPISKISQALFAEGEQIDYKLGKHNSKEIHQLVSAFTAMRKQINQRQEELQVQALHDALTGLPNRILFTERLEQAIKNMHQSQQQMTVMILDLDRFKDINDVLGHSIGDQLLQHVAQRLEYIIRESDTVARLGGDEFAVVAPFTNVASATQFAAKIVNAINDVFEIDSQNLYVGVSIGIAVYPEHGTDASTLIRHSDAAMYVAKRERQGLSVYKESQDKDDAEHLILVESLYNELNNTEFLNLHYQPQIDLANRELLGVEALLRWKHPTLGVISPERIVQIAEYSNQIDKLTDWVICTAFRECTNLMSMENLQFSINLSTKNLQDDELPSRIGALIKEYGVSPALLTLEITESAVMSHPVKAREVMERLSEMDIKLSVDDYGTGFSSLGYLKMLPVNELKIDKTFVMNMLEDESDEIIVRSTIELAHNLGLEVVAEGVEDEDTLMRLRKLKCDTAQGYHISRPVSIQALGIWLEKQPLKVANS